MPPKKQPSPPKVVHQKRSELAQTLKKTKKKVVKRRKTTGTYIRINGKRHLLVPSRIVGQHPPPRPSDSPYVMNQRYSVLAPTFASTKKNYPGPHPFRGLRLPPPSCPPVLPHKPGGRWGPLDPHQWSPPVTVEEHDEIFGPSAGPPPPPEEVADMISYLKEDVAPVPVVVGTTTTGVPITEPTDVPRPPSPEPDPDEPVPEAPPILPLDVPPPILPPVAPEDLEYLKPFKNYEYDPENDHVTIINRLVIGRANKPLCKQCKSLIKNGSRQCRRQTSCIQGCSNFCWYHAAEHNKANKTCADVGYDAEIYQDRLGEDLDEIPLGVQYMARDAAFHLINMVYDANTVYADLDPTHENSAVFALNVCFNRPQVNYLQMATFARNMYIRHHNAKRKEALSTGNEFPLDEAYRSREFYTPDHGGYKIRVVRGFMKARYDITVRRVFATNGAVDADKQESFRIMLRRTSPYKAFLMWHVHDEYFAVIRHVTEPGNPFICCYHPYVALWNITWDEILQQFDIYQFE